MNVIEQLWQIPIAAHRLTEDVGNLFLVGRPVQHFALMPIDDPQHLPAIAVIATAVAPQIGRLDRRHQELLTARRVLFLANDVLDVAQNAQTKR